MTFARSPRSFEYWMNQVQSNPPWAERLNPRLPEVIPHTPTLKQAAFLLLDIREAMYGGAAGGGKSDALLMAALQYIDVPGYSALLLRRRLTDAALPGALLARAHEWLANSGAMWKESERTYSFTEGGTLTFGYLDHPMDRFRYQSSEFQFIGFDELTQFSEAEYTFLFSRLRRTAESIVPLRMRSASNPGGAGHDWVRRRFLVDGPAAGRIFIPATIDDNPHLDRDEYTRSLAELDPKTRAQMLEGDWNAGDDGLLSFDDIARCEADTLWPGGKPPKGSRPELFIGIDVGRTRDRTVVWTWERVGDVLWCRDLCVMENASFSEQKHAIRERLNRFVLRAAIDKGGIGYQLSEELESERDSVVTGVTLTAGMQGRLAQQVATAMQEMRIRIPMDADLRADFRLVRRPEVIGGASRIVTHRGQSGHADRFWAAALGLAAAATYERPLDDTPAALPSSFRG